MAGGISLQELKVYDLRGGWAFGPQILYEKPLPLLYERGPIVPSVFDQQSHVFQVLVVLARVEHHGSVQIVTPLSGVQQRLFFQLGEMERLEPVEGGINQNRGRKVTASAAMFGIDDTVEEKSGEKFFPMNIYGISV